jgi:hypothetical protein
VQIRRFLHAGSLVEDAETGTMQEKPAHLVIQNLARPNIDDGAKVAFLLHGSYTVVTRKPCAHEELRHTFPCSTRRAALRSQMRLAQYLSSEQSGRSGQAVAI